MTFDEMQKEVEGFSLDNLIELALLRAAGLRMSAAHKPPSETGRQISLVITKLEEARLWAHASEVLG